MILNPVVSLLSIPAQSWYWIGIRGTVKIIKDGLLNPIPALDVNVSTDNFRGLLGIAVYNQNQSLLSKPTNPTVFLYYSESPSIDGSDEEITLKEEPLGNRVYRYEFINNTLVNPRLLLDLPASSPGPRHLGGVLAIGIDHNLYLRYLERETVNLIKIIII